MEIINIYGDNRFAEHKKSEKPVVASWCRGEILLSYEVNTDQWMIPGGGVEAGGKRGNLLHPGIGRGNRFSATLISSPLQVARM